MIDNDLIARYVFLKTGGLRFGPEMYLEKKAGITGAGAAAQATAAVTAALIDAGAEVSKLVANIALEKIPVWGVGLGAGAGGLWWMLNRDQEMQKVLHKAKSRKVKKMITKLEQDLDKKYDEKYMGRI